MKIGEKLHSECMELWPYEVNQRFRDFVAEVIFYVLDEVIETTIQQGGGDSATGHDIIKHINQIKDGVKL